MSRKMNERCAHCEKWLDRWDETAKISYYERAEGGKELQPAKLVHKHCLPKILRAHEVHEA